MQKNRQRTDAIAAVRQERHALARQYALRGQDFIQSVSRLLVNRSNECEHLGVAVLRDALSDDNFNYRRL
jgi:hypothetical protein